jgi:IS30 family transposase
MQMNPMEYAAQQRTAPSVPFDLISREELKRLSWDEGLSDAEIAKLYGVSTNTVNRKRHQMNLVQGELTTEQLQEIVRMAEKIKTLPLEAIEQIRQIVHQYTH